MQLFFHSLTSMVLVKLFFFFIVKAWMSNYTSFLYGFNYLFMPYSQTNYVGKSGLWRLSKYKYTITSKGIPITKIRRSHDRLIFVMGIPIPYKKIFILKCPLVTFPGGIFLSGCWPVQVSCQGKCEVAASAWRWRAIYSLAQGSVNSLDPGKNNCHVKYSAVLL